MVNICIVGAGAFGTSLALAFLHNKHEVTLFTRHEEHADDMCLKRCNVKYLNHHVLPTALMITADKTVLSKAHCVLFATPTQYTPNLVQELIAFIPQNASVIFACKGILLDQTRDFPFVFQWFKHQLYPQSFYVLSGPNFASELAFKKPSAATLAGQEAAPTLALSKLLSASHYRIYPSTDLVGVSLCGAIKNVYAIAAGIAHGLDLGNNAKAALITRALAEMKRLGLVLGAQTETFLGLSGVGDLMLSCHSLLSRNMSLGQELAGGKSLEKILKERHTIAEGVYTAKALKQMIDHTKSRMPIASAVNEILYNNLSIDSALNNLLTSPTHNFEND